jgi:UDP-N-acetylglucosamine 2-epimerase (non-hydrolysing)
LFFIHVSTNRKKPRTCYLGIPCLTLRPKTERPVTISQGSNRMCPIAQLEFNVDKVLSNGYKEVVVPELWYGNSASRVVASVATYLGV